MTTFYSVYEDEIADVIFQRCRNRDVCRYIAQLERQLSLDDWHRKMIPVCSQLRTMTNYVRVFSDKFLKMNGMWRVKLWFDHRCGRNMWYAYAL
jgi:hypothetical protein